MNLRATLALTALLVALGAAAWLLREPTSPERARAAVFPGLEAARVQSIRVAGPGGALLLARAGSGWSLGEGRETADAAAVERLLADVAALRIAAVVSTNAARQAGYEADADKGIAVRLEGAGGAVLAAFVVGRSGPDGASAYLRRDGATDVLLVPGDLRFALSRPAESWRRPPDAAAAETPSPPPAERRERP